MRTSASTNVAWVQILNLNYNHILLEFVVDFYPVLMGYSFSFFDFPPPKIISISEFQFDLGSKHCYVNSSLNKHKQFMSLA